MNEMNSTVHFMSASLLLGALSRRELDPIKLTVSMPAVLVAGPTTNKLLRHNVAEKWDCLTKVRLSHFCETVSPLWDSVDRA